MKEDMQMMFFIGGIIFIGYIYGLLRAIRWGHKSQEEERLNDPELRNYYSRHGMLDKADYDGMGNYSRFPNNPYEKKSNGVVLREKTKRTKKQRNFIDKKEDVK